MRLDVIFVDASARTAAFHFMNVHADFSRQATDVRRGGSRCTMFGSRNLAQLLRHGENFGRMRLRLVREKYLRFSFSLGLYGRLQRQAGFVLFGNVFDRSVFRLFRLRRRPAFQGEDHLADFDLVPSLTLISLTVPVTEDGTSTTALSVSSSMTGWPSETFVPGEIISRTRSPWSMFSPNSGKLNSVAPAAPEAGAGSGAAERSSGVTADGAAAWRARHGFAARSFRGSFGLGGFDFGARAIFHGKDHLANFDLLAFFNPNFFYRAGHGRRDFDHGLVGFQFHHRLAFSDARAGRNHQPHQIALVDVLAEFR